MVHRAICRLNPQHPDHDPEATCAGCYGPVRPEVRGAPALSMSRVQHEFGLPWLRRMLKTGKLEQKADGRGFWVTDQSILGG